MGTEFFATATPRAGLVGDCKLRSNLHEVREGISNANACIDNLHFNRGQ